MESQPQNPEFRKNLKTFTHVYLITGQANNCFVHVKFNNWHI